MSGTMVFQFIGETVRNATDAFVTPAATNLMTALGVLTLTSVTLYITLTGYAILTGAVQSPFWTFFKQVIKIVFVAYFALSVEGYIDTIMSAFDGLEVGLSNAMNTSGVPPPSIYAVLDQSLDKGLELVSLCFRHADEAGWSIGSALAWIVAGCTVAIGTVLVTMIGGAVVIVAKFAIAIMFALGPIFVLSLMFPVTAKFFDAWFSQVMHYTLVVVIMSVIMTFAMKAYDVFITAADMNDPATNPLFASLQIGALTGVLIWIIYQAGGMASGLAGGVSMAAMGIRHLISPATGGLRGAKVANDLANPVSTRRDLESGMMTTARRANHLVAGNTMWNPRYRQHVMENLNKNWGWAKGGSVRK